MENILVLSAYIYNKYHEKTKIQLDQLKLHKLLYFVQREAIIQTGEPLFKEIFKAWKFGPVCEKVRKAFQNNEFQENKIEGIPSETGKKIADEILIKYGYKEPWSLSRLTHYEISWKNARKGIDDGANGNVTMLLADIRVDAEKIKLRRQYLENKKTKEYTYNPNYVAELPEEQFEALSNSENDEVVNLSKKLEELEKHLMRSGIRFD